MKTTLTTACFIITPILSSCVPGLFTPDPCSPTIKYTGKSFDVEGLSIPGSNGANSVAKVEIKDQQIQQAGDLAQIMDIHQGAICRSIEQAKRVGITDQAFYMRLIDQQTTSQVAITQFVLASRAGGDAVGRWIDRYQPRAEAIKKEVAQSVGASTPLTVGTVASAIAQNPQAGSLQDAGSRDYRVSKAAPTDAIVPDAHKPPES